MSSKQYFSYNHDKNKLKNKKSKQAAILDVGHILKADHKTLV
jgi:hypothetical protein